MNEDIRSPGPPKKRKLSTIVGMNMTVLRRENIWRNRKSRRTADWTVTAASTKNPAAAAAV
jgi:hypothetical protein